jgi:hypothetical protein
LLFNQNGPSRENFQVLPIYGGSALLPAHI